jgi:polysaccharide biosynthesis protein PslG
MARTLALAAILVTAAVAVVAPAAASATPVTVGLGDQSWNTFGDRYFEALALKQVRVVTPWNVARSRGDRAWLDEYLAATRLGGIEPLVSFGAANGSRCPARPCKLPTSAQFERAFRAFRKRWPWVRTISVWNEENHRSQPTFRYPEQAARYFNIVRKRCRGCRIVAADVIDDPNMVRWIRRFRTVARRPRIWGLHNYRDGNPRRGQRYGGTKLLLKNVPGKVWLTETGGIVKFVLPDGKTLFPYSVKRGNVALGRVLRLARAYRNRIQRLYVYHWRQDDKNRFDSGLIGEDGVPRPSYYTLERWLRTRWFTR